MVGLFFVGSTVKTKKNWIARLVPMASQAADKTTAANRKKLLCSV